MTFSFVRRDKAARNASPLGDERLASSSSARRGRRWVLTSTARCVAATIVRSRSGDEPSLARVSVGVPTMFQPPPAFSVLSPASLAHAADPSALQDTRVIASSVLAACPAK